MVGLQGTRHEVKGEGSVFILETSVGNSSIEWQWCVHIKRCKLAFLQGKFGVVFIFFQCHENKRYYIATLLTTLAAKQTKEK